MPILFPELKGKSQSGLYAISPDKPSKKKKTDFKLGRTVNFTKRLNGYHICWNKGYFIYAILPLRPSLFSANQKKELLQFTKALEKAFFKKLSKRPKDITEELLDTRRYKSEWYVTTPAMLEQLFIEFYAECQQGKHDFMDRRTKQRVTFRDMLLEPITQWNDPFLSKNDEDDELERTRNQMVHVGELQMDPNDPKHMIISKDIPKGLPQPRNRNEALAKREIRSTLQTKYKDHYVDKEL